MLAAVKRELSPLPPQQAFFSLPSVTHLFERYLSQVPVSLAIREVHRLVVLGSLLSSKVSSPPKILDVGCGDGFWWTVFDKLAAKVHGIDISTRELTLASKRLEHAHCLDVSSPGFTAQLKVLAWPLGYDVIIGNCSLEHVRQLDQSLKNIYASLKDGGQLILFVPTPDWPYNGHTMAFLKKHFPRVAMAIAGCFNGFFQHWHLMDQPTWERLLGAYGFRVERSIAMAGPTSEFLFRLGLPSSFLSFLVKKISGHYPNRFLPSFCQRWLACQLSRLLSKEFTIQDPMALQQRHYPYEYAISCTK